MSYTKWVFDGAERIAPRLHRNDAAPRMITPEHFERLLERELKVERRAWNPYD